MDMNSRMKRLEEIRKELSGLSGKEILDAAQRVNAEVVELQNIPIGSIPEYAVWKGNNKEELDTFISGCVNLEISMVSSNIATKELEYCYKADGKWYKLRLLDVVSDDCGLFRPYVEDAYKELDLVGKSILLNGTDKQKQRFKTQVWPHCSFDSSAEYVNKRTYEVVSALQWTSENIAEFKYFLSGFKIEYWGQDKLFGYPNSAYYKGYDTHDRFEVPVGSYFITKKSSESDKFNLIIEGVGMFTSPSTLPDYTYEVVSEATFKEQYMLKEEWDKTGCVITVNGEEIYIQKELIDDLLCTALEGGITYWCDRADVPTVEGYKGVYAHEQISREGTLCLHDAEEDKAYELTLESFLKGMVLYFEQGYGSVEEVVGEEYYDAETADCIVQLALFEDVVYG